MLHSLTRFGLKFSQSRFSGFCALFAVSADDCSGQRLEVRAEMVTMGDSQFVGYLQSILLHI
jgi:hypothetical protein